MNKLDEIRENLILQIGPKTEAGKNGIMQGWHYALALNLPVKFAEWKEDSDIERTNDNYFDIGGYYLPNNKALFDYWLEHIYKPE